MNWKTRLFLRSALPLLPFQYSLRAMKLRLTSFNEVNADGVLRYTGVMIGQLRADGYDFSGKTALELGTGWEPQIPLLLKLAGCTKVMTVDIHRLLNKTSGLRTVAFLKKRREVIIGHLGITAEAFDRYINGITFGTLDDFLRSASIDYLSPCDARNLPLDDASVDLVVSNNVIEHIPPETITAIFREFFRVLRRTGKMAHTIDNCDHWAYTDRSISCVNFLRFEDKTWKRLQFNPIDYQNRLRHFEYVDLLADAGFKVTRDISVVEEVLITALKTLPVCSRYRSVPHEKLAVALSRIIAEKK